MFRIDIETCSVCGGAMRTLAFIQDPVLIEKILAHLHEAPVRDAKAAAAQAARPPFALDRLRELGPERLRYELTKPGPGGSSSLRLTPVELIDRIAALVPPPRPYGYFGAPARTTAYRKFP